MMVSLSDDQNLNAEKALLSEVFEKETRADGEYYLYNYDQKYYKVLSACAKLRLRTKNLPEGNPNFIEVKASDWDAVFSGKSSDADATTTNIRHLSFESPKARDANEQNPQSSALRHSNTVFDDGSLADSPVVLTTPIDDEDTINETVATIKQQVEAIEPDVTFITPAQSPKTESKIMSSADVLDTPSTELNNDINEKMESSYQARVASMKTRESALKMREDAIRIREEAIKAREDALQANEDEIQFTERTIKSKERILTEKSEQLKTLEAEIREQEERLKRQKKEIASLAEYLQHAADKLLADVE